MVEEAADRTLTVESFRTKTRQPPAGFSFLLPRLMPLLTLVALSLPPALWPTVTVAQTPFPSGNMTPLGPTSFDLGTVQLTGGILEREFEFYNGSATDLILGGAFTSCMCTTASFLLPDGTSSEPFGMSRPDGWSATIKPGQRFRILVRFDPAFHGDKGLGPFRRFVYVVSSAPSDGYFTARQKQIPQATVGKLGLSGSVASTFMKKNEELEDPKTNDRHL